MRTDEKKNDIVLLEGGQQVVVAAASFSFLSPNNSRLRGVWEMQDLDRISLI